MKLIFVGVLILIAYSTSASEEFTSAQINKIQGISQSILKVRGQNRRLLMTEYRDVMQDLSKIESSLKSAESGLLVGLEGFKGLDSFQANSDKARQESRNVQSISESHSWFAQVRKLFEADQPEVRDTWRLDKLKAAYDMAVKQRNLREDKIPSAWQFWSEVDPKDKKIRDLMSAIEQDLMALDDKKNLTPEDIKSYREETFGRSYKEYKSDPTIYTITKHH